MKVVVNGKSQVTTLAFKQNGTYRTLNRAVSVLLEYEAGIDALNATNQGAVDGLFQSLRGQLQWVFRLLRMAGSHFN